MEIMTPFFTASYPNLFKPQVNKLSGKEEYSLVALFPKGTNLDALKKAAHEACAKKWGADEKKWPKNIRSPFRDQGEKAKEIDGKTVMPQGHEAGAFFFNLKSKVKPPVYAPDKSPLVESDFYAGCKARALVSAYAYDQLGNRGVSFGLVAVQKVGEGESLTGRANPEEAFTAIENTGPNKPASAMFD